MTGTRTWRRSLLLALPIGALLLAGCTAQAPETAGSGSGSGTAATDDLHAWSVKYAGCMQDEGIDYPDPSPDPNAAMPALNIDELGGMDVFTAADEVCRGKVGDPPPPTGPDGKPLTEKDMREDLLELTRCLREQGVDIDDPSDDRGLMLDETVTAEALEACGMSGVPASSSAE